jgi:hypothetical protein
MRKRDGTLLGTLRLLGPSRGKPFPEYLSESARREISDVVAALSSGELSLSYAECARVICEFLKKNGAAVRSEVVVSRYLSRMVKQYVARKTRS